MNPGHHPKGLVCAISGAERTRTADPLLAKQPPLNGVLTRENAGREGAEEAQLCAQSTFSGKTGGAVPGREAAWLGPIDCRQTIELLRDIAAEQHLQDERDEYERLRTEVAHSDRGSLLA
jgi:hypothetical protein